jgi:hypothetical protein
MYGLVCFIGFWCCGFGIARGDSGTVNFMGHIFPFIPFLQGMGCHLNEMFCKQDGVWPHSADIANFLWV